MKRKFSTPHLTRFGRLEDITAESGEFRSGSPADREREEQMEEIGDDFESIGVVRPDLEGEERERGRH